MAIRFIRKHGRIIPIHERIADAGKGAAAVVAGKAVAVGTAKVASRMVLEAAHAENQAADIARATQATMAAAKRFGATNATLRRFGIATLRRQIPATAAARLIFTKRNAVLAGGVAASAGLIATGVSHLGKAVTGRTDGGPSKATIAGATSVGVTALYWKQLGGGSIMGHAVSALRRRVGL